MILSANRRGAFTASAIATRSCGWIPGLAVAVQCSPCQNGSVSHWIERLNVPVAHFVVLLVCSIKIRFQIVNEAIRSADLFRRTSPFSVHRYRILRIRVAVANLFDDHFVASVVVVVDIDESPHVPRNRGAQLRVPALYISGLSPSSQYDGSLRHRPMISNSQRCENIQPMIIWIASCNSSSVVDKRMPTRRNTFVSSSCNSVRNRAIRSPIIPPCDLPFARDGMGPASSTSNRLILAGLLRYHLIHRDRAALR